jgi:hypothetical protein
MGTCWNTVPLPSATKAPICCGALWNSIVPAWLAGRWVAPSVTVSPGLAELTDRDRLGDGCCP